MQPIHSTKYVLTGSVPDAGNAAVNRQIQILALEDLDSPGAEAGTELPGKRHRSQNVREVGGLGDVASLQRPHPRAPQAHLSSPENSPSFPPLFWLSLPHRSLLRPGV